MIMSIMNVSYTHLAGIIKGISDTEFSPDEGINRAETAALLLRMTGKENETAEPMFSDVTADDW